MLVKFIIFSVGTIFGFFICSLLSVSGSADDGVTKNE